MSSRIPIHSLAVRFTFQEQQFPFSTDNTTPYWKAFVNDTPACSTYPCWTATRQRAASSGARLPLLLTISNIFRHLNIFHSRRQSSFKCTGFLLNRHLFSENGQFSVQLSRRLGAWPSRAVEGPLGGCADAVQGRNLATKFGQ